MRIIFVTLCSRILTSPVPRSFHSGGTASLSKRNNRARLQNKQKKNITMQPRYIFSQVFTFNVDLGLPSSSCSLTASFKCIFRGHRQTSQCQSVRPSFCIIIKCSSTLCKLQEITRYIQQWFFFFHQGECRLLALISTVFYTTTYYQSLDLITSEPVSFQSPDNCCNSSMPVSFDYPIWANLFLLFLSHCQLLLLLTRLLPLTSLHQSPFANQSVSLSLSFLTKLHYPVCLHLWASLQCLSFCYCATQKSLTFW